jgi:hypothetical protein
VAEGGWNPSVVGGLGTGSRSQIKDMMVDLRRVSAFVEVSDDDFLARASFSDDSDAVEDVEDEPHGEPFV